LLRRFAPRKEECLYEKAGQRVQPLDATRQGTSCAVRTGHSFVSPRKNKLLNMNSVKARCYFYFIKNNIFYNLTKD